MKRKIYWKDILQAIGKSKGRFLSIMGLMGLGAFALVGLKVASPNMVATAQTYLNQHETMDLAVMADYGLSEADKTELEGLADTKVELGYLTDVTLDKKDEAVRLFSLPEKLSSYVLVSGHLPEKDGDIALSQTYATDYKIGDNITFSHDERSSLKSETFTITGFVTSSEIWSKTAMGNSQAGSGLLTGYGVVTATSFDSEVYHIARFAYEDLRGKNPFDTDYLDKLTRHQDELHDLLADNGSVRLASLKDAAEKNIAQGEVQIAAAKSQLALFENQAVSPELSTSLAQQKTAAESQIQQAEQELAKARQQLSQLKTPTYTTYTRSSLPGGEGYQTFSNSTASIAQVANIFPVVLYLVAALVTFTTMTRFVDEERLNAGIFAALGYTQKDIIRKFIIYGLVASLLGTVIGGVAGNYILAPMIADIIVNDLVLGEIGSHFYLLYAVLPLILALFSAVLPAYLIAKRELKAKPAHLLLPKPPVAGSKILLERLTFVWKRLSFTHKVTARNIFRYKQRGLMTVFGVAGAVALLFAGLGIRSSISGVATRQFGDILRYDMIVLKNDKADTAATAALDKALKSDDITQTSAVHLTNFEQKFADVREPQSVTVMVTQDKDFAQLVQLKDSQTQKVINLSDTGVVLSEKLAQFYGVTSGDNLKLTLDGETYTVKVRAVAQNYTGHFIWMNQAAYRKITGKDVNANASLVKTKSYQLRDVKQKAHDFLQLEAVLAVSQNTSLVEQVSTIVSSLTSVMLILVIVSILLAVVILYNLTNINVAERIRELSTIKVLGFHNKEVTMYIYRETIVLSLIGIITGFYGGHLLHQFLIKMIAPATILFDPSVGLDVILVPIMVICLILLVLGVLVNHTLRRVDMLEALKSVE